MSKLKELRATSSGQMTMNLHRGNEVDSGQKLSCERNVTLARGSHVAAFTALGSCEQALKEIQVC